MYEKDYLTLVFDPYQDVLEEELAEEKTDEEKLNNTSQLFSEPCAHYSLSFANL